MTNGEMSDLNLKYWCAEGYTFPGGFEHRLDQDSSACLYSLIRHFKPNKVLAIGTWEGGSTCVIMAALLKNKEETGKDFIYVASELLDGKRMATEAHCLEKHNRAPIMIGDITQNLSMVPSKIDFLFSDHDHDKETTAWEFENILPRVKKGSLICFHDWAVEELSDGRWSGKGKDGCGGWPETQYIMDLHAAGTLPMKKLWWNWHNPDQWETGFFTKI